VTVLEHGDSVRKRRKAKEKVVILDFAEVDIDARRVLQPSTDESKASNDFGRASKRQNQAGMDL